MPTIEDLRGDMLQTHPPAVSTDIGTWLAHHQESAQQTSTTPGVAHDRLDRSTRYSNPACLAQKPRPAPTEPAAGLLPPGDARRLRGVYRLERIDDQPAPPWGTRDVRSLKAWFDTIGGIPYVSIEEAAGVPPHHFVVGGQWSGTGELVATMSVGDDPRTIGPLDQVSGQLTADGALDVYLRHAGTEHYRGVREAQAPLGPMTSAPVDQSVPADAAGVYLVDIHGGLDGRARLTLLSVKEGQESEHFAASLVYPACGPQEIVIHLPFATVERGELVLSQFNPNPEDHNHPAPDAPLTYVRLAIPALLEQPRRIDGIIAGGFRIDPHTITGERVHAFESPPKR